MSDLGEDDPDDPPYEYVLFIDEAGDTGLRVDGAEGTSEWFCLAGILMAKRYEPDTTAWVQDIRREVGSYQGPELHFKALAEWNKVKACQMLSALPLRAFALLSHKQNMRGYSNARAAKIPSQNYFYNWCLRVLLERASHLVGLSSKKRFAGPRLMKVVMARTGALQYSQTCAYIEYLRGQALNKATYLSAREINPKVLHMRLIKPIMARYAPGAQLADIVASAFYNAVNDRAEPPLYLPPAMALERVMAKQDELVSGYGLCLMPWNGEIPEKHRPIFEHYGRVWDEK